MPTGDNFTQTVDLCTEKSLFTEFSVGNYRSFKQRVTLSMVAAEIASQPPSLDAHNVFSAGAGLRLLSSAAIYGANASGKSNLIGALDFMRTFVLSSVQETTPNQRINVEPFRLGTEQKDAPSHFEIVFLVAAEQYRYGFEVTQEQVTKEWLYRLGSRREANLFARDHNLFTINSRQFREGRGLDERTRPNALFLSVVAQFNGAIAGTLVRWFADLTILRGLEPAVEALRFRRNFEAHPYRRAIETLMKGYDIGINALAVEQRPLALASAGSEVDGVAQAVLKALQQQGAPLEQTHILTTHGVYDAQGQAAGTVVFDLDTQESDGTRRLFSLAHPLIQALVEGRIVIVDELDARLHPNLALELIRLFHHPEGNERHAQLIFTTHNTNLLSAKLFRRDQVWFVEKSRQGASDLYSLVEYRGDGKLVRNDASFEKDYIAGRYGAVPFIGDLGALLGAEREQTAQS